MINASVMVEEIPVKQKIVPEETFRISRMKQKIKATHPHKHDHYHELIFLSAGTGFHTIDLKEIPIHPPQLFLVKAGQTHHWEFTTIPEGFVVIFRSDFLIHLLSSVIVTDFEQLQDKAYKLKETEAKSLEAVFEQMQNEFNEHNEQDQRIIASFLEVVLARMIRYSRPAKQAPANSQQKLVNRYKKLIHEHLYGKHLVKHYAEQLYVSPKHLNEACKSVSDQTASQILNESIILEAKRRLLYTSDTVAEIGYALGFNDPSNFSSFFKRHTSITPGVFRHKML